MLRRIKAKLSASTSVKLHLPSQPVKIEAADPEGNKPARFESLAYSGGVVSRYTATPALDVDYVINLAGMKNGRSPKANLDHKTSQRVGHVSEYANDGKELKLGGVFSAATAHRDEVVQSAVSGFEWENSIEAELGGLRRLRSGESEVVNGQKLNGPLIIFDQSVLTGLAFVSRGADEGNAVRIAASAAGDENMNEFEKYCASLGITDLESLNDGQRANLKASFDATQKVNPKNKTSFAQLAAKEREENDRQEQIHAVALSACRDFPMYIDKIEAAVDSAIESRMSADDFELQILRTTRNMAGSINSRLANPRTDAKVIECALSMQAGLSNIEKHYNEQTLDAVHASGMQGIGIQQILIQAAHQNGFTCRAGERVHIGNIRFVLEYAFPPAHARLSGLSTVALPNILGNVANKMILDGYMEEDQTWRDIAEVRPVTNLQTQNFYRMLDDLEYQKVGSSGEIPHGKLSEETYTGKADIYAKMLGISLEQILNDDAGAFIDIRNRLGMGAALKFSNLFWANFMDNATFFTTGRGNYLVGSSYALGLDGVGLEAGVTTYRKLRSPVADGQKRVGTVTNPTIALVPPELEFIAGKHYVGSNVNTGGSSTANSVPNANVHAGKYRPVVQNRLSDAGFTGYSDKAWYLFGARLKPMVATFFQNMQAPTVQSTDADFGTLGIQFRGWHIFGCNPAEYLSGVKIKGEN